MTTDSKRPLRALVGTLLALAVPVALAGEITLFEHRDFRGDSITLHRGAPNLDRTGLNNTASSIIVRDGVWEVCSDAYFRGRCTQLQPGEYGRLDSVLNDISSVREIVTTTGVVPPTTTSGVMPPNTTIVTTTGARIALFERPGFTGRAIELTKTNGNLDRFGPFSGPDAVIVYSGTWRLCTREYYRGECWDFAPGRYDDLGALRGRVASAELVSVTSAPVGVAPAPAIAVVPPSAAVGIAPPPSGPGRVVLYEFPNFGGQSYTIYARDLPNLNRIGFSDRAASMRIEEGYWMFCTDAQFQGDCRTLGPGEYPWLPPDVNRKIVSVRRVNDFYGAISTPGRYFR